MKSLLENKPQLNIQKRKIELKKVLLMILLGMAVQVAASFILTFILEQLPELESRYVSDMESLLQISPYIIFSVCFAFPICEELFFRGLIFGLMKRIAPFVVANITQALVFGIYHGNLVQGVYAFWLGLYIGWIYMLSGKIIYTCILHMSINMLGLVIDKIIPMDSSIWIQCLAALIAFVVIAGITSLLIKESKVEDGLADCK